jgi:alcohol dehydrogenase YqhD (iron-dependent ADH family)
MQIDFATSGRIIFGPGKIKDLPQLIKEFGRKAFIVRSKSQPTAAQLPKTLREQGLM